MPAPFHRAVAVLTHHGARLPVVGPSFGRAHAWLVRRSGGRLGGSWLGAPVLVLETVGRRTGARRETALLYVRVEDGGEGGGGDGGLALLGANAGNASPPGWWFNLCAAETVGVVLDGTRHEMRWRLAEGAERERLLSRFMEVYPPAREYARFTERPLPVAVLTAA